MQSMQCCLGVDVAESMRGTKETERRNRGLLNHLRVSAKHGSKDDERDVHDEPDGAHIPIPRPPHPLIYTLISFRSKKEKKEATHMTALVISIFTSIFPIDGRTLLWNVDLD